MNKSIEYNSNFTLKDLEDLLNGLDRNNEPVRYGSDMAIASAHMVIAMNEHKLKQTGRTTRLIDQMIQDVFTRAGEWVGAVDHHNETLSHKRLFHRVLRRMHMEHRGIMNSHLIDIDQKGLRIRLVIDPKRLAEVKKRLNG